LRAGWKKKSADRLVYVIVRTVESLVQPLPWRTARAVCCLLGDAAYLFDSKRRRRNALSNLWRAFPELDEAARRRILRGAYRHMAVSLLDSLNFARLAASRPTGELLGTLYTDEDGWYMWQYKHKGRRADYTVELPAYNLAQTVTLKGNAFVVVDFTVP